MKKPTQHEFCALTTDSIESLENELSAIVSRIEQRKDNLVSKAGFCANSTIEGLCDGSISVTTDEERDRIHEIKQELMSRTGEIMENARARNLARRAAKKALRQASRG
jgi:Mg2+ and Co2+ transporter CorA